MLSEKKKKALIIQIVPPDIEEKEKQEKMLELENLTITYKWVAVIKKIQKKAKPDYKFFIWKGKLEEIKNEIENKKIDILIIGNILKPHQTYNIWEEMKDLKINVWDKIDLILKIFEKHANSTEAKLQIELASIKHMGPRIFWMWTELSRQWGWIWTRGKWETNIQLMKKHLQDKENKIKKKLKHYQKVRDQHRRSRNKKKLPTVGIVWYTNAWKSSLLNALTSKGSIEKNELFATLWTNVGSFFVPSEEWKWKTVLLNDTIWFIRDLPPSLIEAFSSTLEDSIKSELLLHVIDSNDSNIEEKIKIVEDILDQIQANQPKIYVFNKIDKISKKRLSELEKKYNNLNTIFVSSTEKIGLEKLKQKIIKML